MGHFIKGHNIGARGNLRAYSRATIRVAEGEEVVRSWVLRDVLTNTVCRFRNHGALMRNMEARANPHRVEHEFSKVGEDDE